MEAFSVTSPVLLALAAGMVTWFVTLLGASLVLFAKEVKQKTMDAMLGFAAGVMIAASFWSLLAPAIELSAKGPLPRWLPPALGFVAGAAFLRLVDKILPHLHIGFPMSEAEGIKTKLPRSALLVLAVTLHNIPEGLAVGVAFGALASGLPEATLAAVVEPVAAVIGAAAVMLITPLLPYALAFAAGAMIFVVVEEVVPEAQRAGNADLATGGVIAGFVAMMILDVAFA